MSLSNTCALSSSLTHSLLSYFLSHTHTHSHSSRSPEPAADSAELNDLKRGMSVYSLSLVLFLSKYTLTLTHAFSHSHSSRLHSHLYVGAQSGDTYTLPPTHSHSLSPSHTLSTLSTHTLTHTHLTHSHTPADKQRLERKVETLQKELAEEKAKNSSGGGGKSAGGGEEVKHNYAHLHACTHRHTCNTCTTHMSIQLH